MRYFIYTNQNEPSKEIEKYILEKLHDDKNFIYDEEKPELIISIGGDGCMLRCIHSFIDNLNGIAFVGISTGKLGYFCDFKSDEVDEFLSYLRSKTPRYESFKLIKLNHNRYNGYFVNEARIEKVFNTLNCSLYINDSFIEVFRGNGFNISTSLGSTAYNRSLGGPLVNPKIETMIIGEIAPINHNAYGGLNSFVVLKPNDEITLKGNFNDCFIGGDIEYKHLINEKSDTQIKITLSDKKVYFARFKTIKYYDKLRISYVKGN